MLNLEKLLAYKIPDTEMTLTRRDSKFYALSVGLGQDPLDYEQLKFVRGEDLVAMPSMVTTIAMPYAWIKKADAGFSGKSVHAGMHFRLHRPLPVEGKFRSENSVGEILDKGPGKAAVISNLRKIYDTSTGDLIAEIRSTNMYRGDGGFGGPSKPSEPQVEIPTRTPDDVYEMKTFPQQGLFYALNGDPNPLHTDPDTARRQGFAQPIIHGLATYGVTCHALLKHLCGYDPAKLRSMSANFTRPVFPGDTIQVRIWRTADGATFQTFVPGRGNEIVLDHGHIEVDR